MRELGLRSLLFGLALGGASLVADGAWSQEADPARARHPWANFDIGTWKRVRVLTETLDEQGRVTSASTRETTTALVAVEDASYTLRADVAVEVAGKRFVAQPQYKKQGFHGELNGQSVSVTKVGPGEVQINGSKFASEIQQIVIEDKAVRQVTTIHYAANEFPFVLKRDTSITDLSGETGNSETTLQLIALDMPYKVLAEIKPVSFVQIRQSDAKSETLTLEVHCQDVPGGVVSHTSKQLDKQGRVTSRSTLELLDYGAGAAQGDDRVLLRPRLFPRLRQLPR